jgi:hypothetical protein
MAKPSGRVGDGRLRLLRRVDSRRQRATSRRLLPKVTLEVKRRQAPRSKSFMIRGVGKHAWPQLIAQWP